jgi:hypothetical protein
MPTATPTPALVYHPTVDRIVIRYLRTPAAPTRLRRDAESSKTDLLSRLLHLEALRLAERDIQLTRAIRHTQTDLEAAATELADGLCAEQLLTGRSDQLAILAHRYRDALDHLEPLAQLWASDRTDSGEPTR